MKLTVAKRMALLVGAALIGIAILAGIGQYQMKQVFEAANYGNVNTTPSLFLLDDIQRNFLSTRLEVNRHVINIDDKAMAEITAAGKVPLLVGGTILYFRALLQGLAELPQADPALRAEIDAEAAMHGWPAIHARLASLGPATAARLVCIGLIVAGIIGLKLTSGG